ncbi:MAG: hypothetical protein FIB02_10710, partial [Desulfuromonas sp.]|nr:hypothetical protein [Desulfuromonas sp.]
MHASSGRFFSRTISHVFPLACALCSFLVIVSLSTPAFALQAGGSAPVIQAESQRQCGKDWMSRGMIGLSTHYFVLRTEDNERLAAQFDAKKVAEQAADAGAAWFLFTLHHQAWIMMAPNATYDRIVGSGDYTAARDVPLELIRQLDKSGVKLMLYVNLRLDQKSAASALVRDRMGGWPPNDKLIENIAAVYREFSLRYGKNVVGWWVDGARLKEYRNSPNRERRFKTIADALRAGNPEALVAIKPGIEV